MAGATLFTLIDDIAAVLDDIALMTKLSAKKTAGVIGDDLALNANQVSGKDIRAERELPIVWSVAKGSLLNKAILIPIALLLSAYLPWLITPLLMVGGAYLCFEGVEKLLHQMLHKNSENAPLVEHSESDKIKGAIRTDFILSAEIVIIALGVMQGTSMTTQIISLSLVGIGITAFVYGLVGLIVKLDDIGLWLLNKPNSLAKIIGKSLLFAMPWLMKVLSVVGTIAMFLVGGGIFTHNVHIIHHLIETTLPSTLIVLGDFAVGIIVGSLCCAVVLPLMKLFKKAH